MNNFQKKDFTTIACTRQDFSKWCHNNPEQALKINSEYREFKKIVKDIIESYVVATSNTTHGVKLPFYIGELSTKYVNSTTPFFVKEQSAPEKKTTTFKYCNKW